MTILSLMVCTSLVGCSGAPTAGKSGFLRDYSQLKKDSDGAMRYMNPRISLKEYNKFVIDPIVIHFAPKADGTSVNPENLKKVTDYFQKRLVKGLTESGRYQVVTEPGPGVLRLRIAITGIKKGTAALNILPQTKLVGGGLGGAAFEAEAVDSVSGERVGAVMESESGSRFNYGAGMTALGYAKAVINNWVERFVKRLDEAHGYTTG